MDLDGRSSRTAQLEITEVMFNPLAAQDNAWEWVEVRNLGASAVDLDGALQLVSVMTKPSPRPWTALLRPTR